MGRNYPEASWELTLKFTSLLIKDGVTEDPRFFDYCKNSKELKGLVNYYWENIRSLLDSDEIDGIYVEITDISYGISEDSIGNWEPYLDVEILIEAEFMGSITELLDHIEGVLYKIDVDKVLSMEEVSE